MISLIYRTADALRRRLARDDHGRIGEDLAHRYLRRHGCTVVARNHRTASGSGEVDLVVWHNTTLVFVEVKTRASEEFGTPDRAVDSEKQQHIRKAAWDYARRVGVPWEKTRFDIVSVVLSDTPRIDWIRDAFRRSPTIGA